MDKNLAETLSLIIVVPGDSVPGHKITRVIGMESLDIEQMTYTSGGPWDSAQYIENPSGKAMQKLTLGFQYHAHLRKGNAVVSFNQTAGRSYTNRAKDRFTTYYATGLIVEVEPA